MFSNQTPNYGLPQWQNEDTPTWLADMNGAFANIDENLKRVEDKVDEGGVPQEIIDRIVALETSVTNILAKIGTDVIDTIGTSITNAIVNLKSAIDAAQINIVNITNAIFGEVIAIKNTNKTYNSFPIYKAAFEETLGRGSIENNIQINQSVLPDDIKNNILGIIKFNITIYRGMSIITPAEVIIDSTNWEYTVKTYNDSGSSQILHMYFEIEYTRNN